MKKIIIILLVLSLLLITGCEKEKETNKVISNGKTINTSKMEHKHCTRKAQMTGGDVKLNYDLYYTGDVLNILKAEEQVISSSAEILDTVSGITTLNIFEQLAKALLSIFSTI